MIKELQWIYRHPPVVGRGLNRIYHTKMGSRKGYAEGVPLFDLDWDVCAILDACRYDIYKEVVSSHDLGGKLKCRPSPASSTPEWLMRSFQNTTHTDIVYVTANPQYYNHENDLDPTFHKIINVWKDNWDEDLQTVPPAKMSKAVKDASDEFPNKRILAHFVQPHVPFIGEFGRQKFPISLNSAVDNDWNAARKFWPSIRQEEREYTDEDLREAYIENIEVVLNEVLPLFKSIDGKPLITSDHGQLLGERISPLPIKEYGHPAGIYVPELIETPIHFLDFKQRREITKGDLENKKEIASDSVDERLNALGYK
ncbi:alkaline phosphatase family protein [Halococcoides cellulosivorans]|uniref:hypothetical protein n=1 Tax=Halococcoides cellulosivorans TaxID=1679096 RepID=UPI00131F02EE|nr:hypothetical protein [Halococcoides cellulosivorans]